MLKIRDELKQFAGNPFFCGGLLLVTIVSYITQLVSPTIGIDDTAYKLYFVDGVAPAAGRWVLFLLKYLFPMDYNPYFMEFIGILLFAGSVLLWCVVFRRVFQNRMPLQVYFFAACMFVSSPILAELSVWYLQNGIHLGYGFTALAVLLFDDSCGERNIKGKGVRLVECMALLTVAVGLYESFVLVFIISVILVFAGRRMERGRQKTTLVNWGASGGITLLGMLLFRTIIMKSMYVVFHLENQRLINQRGLGEGLVWLSGEKSLKDAIYLCKSFFVKYYVAGIVYWPVLIAAIAMGIVVVWFAAGAVKKRDFSLVFAALMVVILPLLMSFLEGVPSYYRSAQYIPVLTSMAVLCTGACLINQKGRRREIVLYICLVIVLYRQCYEMNKWLYVEKIKYEDARETVAELTDFLEENGWENMPVCFVGSYEMPDIIWDTVSVPKWSKKTALMDKIVALADPAIMEEYETKAGICAAETPRLNFVNWGRVAFHTYNRELHKFAYMHGLDLQEDLNTEHYREAEQLLKDSGVFPAADSVTVQKDFIAIRIGTAE